MSDKSNNLVIANGKSFDVPQWIDTDFFASAISKNEDHYSSIFDYLVECIFVRDSTDDDPGAPFEKIVGFDKSVEVDWTVRPGDNSIPVRYFETKDFEAVAVGIFKVSFLLPYNSIIEVLSGIFTPVEFQFKNNWKVEATEDGVLVTVDEMGPWIDFSDSLVVIGPEDLEHEFYSVAVDEPRNEFEEILEEVLQEAAERTTDDEEDSEFFHKLMKTPEGNNFRVIIASHMD